jgi:hypothetical protein
MVFCNVEHCMCDIGGQCSMYHNPSPHGTSRTSTYPYEGIACGYKLELKGSPFDCVCDLPNCVNTWVGKIDTLCQWIPL